MRVTVGQMRADEIGFVTKAWKFGLRDTAANSPLPGRVFFSRANTEVDEVLRGATVLVARDVDDPAFAYGFIAFETNPKVLCVHWAYTRSGFRGQRLALRLLAEAAEHAPDGCERIYTTRTRFDHVAERFGFRFVPVYPALRQIRGHQ